MALSRYSVTSGGVYVAAALRIGIGVVLVMVAPISRAPRILRVFGIIAVLAGVTTLFLGADRGQAIVEWWSGQGSAFIRLWAMLPLVLGGFLAYAILRPVESEGLRD